METIEIPKPAWAVKRSDLWDLFEEERAEILKLKWIESERAEHDIGMVAALHQWLQQHHDKWAAGRKSKG